TTFIMSQPAIENPVIPFTEHINGVFRGRTFVISGTILPNATRFSVNLMYGVDNIGFHCNPRINEGNIVVCNNRVDGEWHTEEKTPPGKFPFKVGGDFTMMILCTERKIKVFVNQKHLLGFKHRVELYKISRINVEGDMSVKTLSFGMLGSIAFSLTFEMHSCSSFMVWHGVKPQLCGLEQKNWRMLSSNLFSTILKAVDTLVAVPYPNIKFHDVTFIGRPRGTYGDFFNMTIAYYSVIFFIIGLNFVSLYYRFSINFLGKDSNNIVFHVNPRFDEKQIVRNSLLDNQWGNEDRTLNMDFPFTPNTPFMVVVKVDKKGFTLMLNGFHLFNFAHRFKPLRNIRSVDFRGDVNMHKIIFN
uniref:Galectin n=1 Tax=Ciona intestinalis TaxID=7719 RepID=F7BJL5_CIOIN